jgi:hypothetical protein
MTHNIKEIFTICKLRNFVIGETIGKFFAFLIGLWSANLFTYQVLERKSIHNLFGLLPRKEIVVHITPRWVELLFAALIGFIVMEIFYFLIQLINTKWMWERTKRGYNSLKGKKSEDQIN